MEVVDDLEATIVGLGTRSGLDLDSAVFLGVALREALTNAIRHGNGCAPDRPVQVRIVLEGGSLTLTVRDWGPGFEVDSLPDPAAPENQCRNCGRGIFFMRQFADEVVFRHPDGGGQAVELRKRLP
jgi:serine/threonine-protein kinase RsbW